MNHPSALIALLILFGCNPLTQPPAGGAGGTVPQPAATASGAHGTGGASPAGDTGPCRVAYERAEALGCPPAGPKTGTWISACEVAREHAIDVGAGCMLGATDCVEMETCAK